MDNSTIAKEWFKIARADFLSAKYLQTMPKAPVEIICYHCQQSAEKHLKGFLAFKGEKINKTHDLVPLVKKCQEYEKDFNSIEEACLMLTDYGVNVRYPFPMDLNESDMKISLEHTKTIMDFVLKKANI